MLGNTNTCQFRWAKTWSATGNGTTNNRDYRQYSCLYHDWCILNFTTWFAIYRPTVAKTAGLPICPWFLTGEMAPFLRQSKESGADLVGIVSEEIVLWSSGILRPIYIFFFGNRNKESDEMTWIFIMNNVLRFLQLNTELISFLYSIVLRYVATSIECSIHIYFLCDIWKYDDRFEMFKILSLFWNDKILFGSVLFVFARLNRVN